MLQWLPVRRPRLMAWAASCRPESRLTSCKPYASQVARRNARLDVAHFSEVPRARQSSAEERLAGPSKYADSSDSRSVTARLAVHNIHPPPPQSQLRHIATRHSVAVFAYRDHAIHPFYKDLLTVPVTPEAEILLAHKIRAASQPLWWECQLLQSGSLGVVRSKAISRMGAHVKLGLASLGYDQFGTPLPVASVSGQAVEAPKIFNHLAAYALHGSLWVHMHDARRVCNLSGEELQSFVVECLRALTRALGTERDNQNWAKGTSGPNTKAKKKNHQARA